MIRKISIGLDYKNAMHFTVGQYLRENRVSLITQKQPNVYCVYLQLPSGESFLWKEYVNMPVTVEYNLDDF